MAGHRPGTKVCIRCTFRSEVLLHFCDESQHFRPLFRGWGGIRYQLEHAVNRGSVSLWALVLPWALGPPRGGVRWPERHP